MKRFVKKFGKKVFSRDVQRPKSSIKQKISSKGIRCVSKLKTRLIKNSMQKKKLRALDMRKEHYLSLLEK